MTRSQSRTLGVLIEPKAIEPRRKLSHKNGSKKISFDDLAVDSKVWLYGRFLYIFYILYKYGH